jgi:phosphoglycolate phosphatase
MFRAVIFDLDGTLMDTGREIHAALALAFAEVGVEALPQRDVEALIGRGVRSLVERALARQGAPASKAPGAMERFERHYAELAGTQACLFPGAESGIGLLRARGRRLAVVTNKPRLFTEKLLERGGVARYFEAVVSGDDGIARKPAGDMLEAACARLGTTPAETLMLGDSENDIQAARAAGCPVWCVPYGYNEGRGPETLSCDRLVESIEDAARLVIALS